VRLAGDLDANILFLECVSSQNTLLERLGRREGEGGPSDARREHLPGLIQEFEPLDEPPAENRMRIDTEAPLEAGLASVLSIVYSKKQAQVERMIGRL
ncbi:MAG: hypothetical protein P4L55_14330, partial [Syntrophobacteraceae bacterium]|nr:hypothetical protein [Syntrophobacteraceae bacterium]